MVAAWPGRRCTRTTDPDSHARDRCRTGATPTTDAGRTMTDAPLFDPADFTIPPGITHVCAGGETACLRRHDAALSRYLHDKSSGMAGRVAQEAEIARARAGI